MRKEVPDADYLDAVRGGELEEVAVSAYQILRTTAYRAVNEFVVAGIGLNVLTFSTDLHSEYGRRTSSTIDRMSPAVRSNFG